MRRPSPAPHLTRNRAVEKRISYAREELVGGPLPNGRRKLAAVSRGDAYANSEIGESMTTGSNRATAVRVSPTGAFPALQSPRQLH
jgi:hypothetical protein